MSNNKPKSPNSSKELPRLPVFENFPIPDEEEALRKELLRQKIVYYRVRNKGRVPGYGTYKKELEELAHDGATPLGLVQYCKNCTHCNTSD